MWDTHCHMPPLLAVRKGIWGLLPRPILARTPNPHCPVDQEMGPCLILLRKDCFTGHGPLWPHGAWAGRQYRPPPQAF